MTREYLLFLKRMLLEPAYRHEHLEMRRLTKLPRYSAAITDILGASLEIIDNTSFFAMYQEVFNNEIYRFESKTSEPYIIDGGANIGLSVIFFKKLYPNARVVAFEPDSDVRAVLERNLESFGYSDVVVHEAALWSSKTRLSFAGDGADSGRVTQDRDSGSTLVNAVRARDYLGEHVDFLKLDIEGAELEVLEDCADSLKNVDNLFVEYHSFADRPQTLPRLLEILITAGFRIKGDTPNAPKRPFIDRGQYLGMDFLINIYAFRP